MAEPQKKKKHHNKDRRNVWLLVVIALLVIGSIVMFTPPQEKINQGLDIQGGLSVVLTAAFIVGATAFFLRRKRTAATSDIDSPVE